MEGREGALQFVASKTRFDLPSGHGRTGRSDGSKSGHRRNQMNKMCIRDRDAYLKEREEAVKRDHNKLGRELEYFTTVDCIGQGLPCLLYTSRCV